MLRELAAVVEGAGQSSDVHLIVVSGAGDRAFSASYDIGSIAEGGDARVGRRAFLERRRPRFAGA